jgi:hypothetical protein
MNCLRLAALAVLWNCVDFRFGLWLFLLAVCVTANVSSLMRGSRSHRNHAPTTAGSISGGLPEELPADPFDRVAQEGRLAATYVLSKHGLASWPASSTDQQRG